MAGHSRPKDGVLSHAYVPAMTPRVWRARPFNRQSFIFNCQTAARAGMPARVKNMRHHPYCLARPRVGPSSRCLPSNDEGDGAPRGATIVFCMPAFPLGNAGRRSARHPDRLAHVRIYLRRLPSCAGPRFSWPPVTHGDGLRQPAPGGRPLLATRRSPGAARVRALRGTPAGAASGPTPHDAS